jgi:hypothetical protein
MTARPTLPPDAAAFAAQIPYAFAKAHGVLAAGVTGDTVVVLTRPDATPDGVVEIRRVLQRPLVVRAVDAERFAAELARAYNAAAAGVAQLSDDLSRDTDLARLMQEHFTDVVVTGCCHHLPGAHHLTRFPVIWRLIQFAVRECDPHKAVTLIACAKKTAK